MKNFYLFFLVLYFLFGFVVLYFLFGLGFSIFFCVFFVEVRGSGGAKVPL